MTLKFICKYCDHNWLCYLLSREAIEEQKCPRCKDSNLTYKEVNSERLDTYKGSPPFVHYYSPEDTDNFEGPFTEAPTYNMAEFWNFELYKKKKF